MSTPALHAVILAGGSGTRFWPASRAARPKQYLSLTGVTSMIERTCARLEGLVPWERILVVAPESQAELVRAALPRLSHENLLLEPCGRNTAVCVALAALELEARGADPLQVVLPADHLIEPAKELRRAIAHAAEEAEATASLITFGIRPRHPATGYGYIELGQELGRRGGAPVHAVRRFVEKPDRARAESFLATGRFLWNSGMFAWRTSVVLAGLRAHAPEVLRALESARTPEARRAAYERLPALPVDVALLERASNVRVLPIDFAWSDVGSWSALPEVLAPDAAGNFLALSGGAQHIALDSRGCVVFSEGAEIIATIGVRDLIVVRAGNATLVCPRERAEDVKKIVEQLRARDPGWT